MSVLPDSPAPKTTEGSERFRIAGLPLTAIAFLCLTAVIELLWSHYQLLWSDEFNQLETDSIPGLGRLIHIQLTAPISFDPIGYNVLLHGVIRFLGPSAFALRVPSICGYLLMQICLFYFVRRIATERAAIFALAFPALVGIVLYGAQARPYGVILGLSGIAMLSWQTATQGDRRRTFALWTLSLSLAVAINTQYYGVLLFVPVCGAEIVRSFERRRVDVPVLVSIVAGMAGMALVLPFASALSPFRTQYSALEATSIHFIPHSYLWLLVGSVNWSLATQHLAGTAGAILFLGLAASFVYFRSRVRIRLPRAEAMFLVLLTGFPVLGYVLAVFVTHLVELRYILPAIVGIAAILGILTAPLLEEKVVGRVLLTSLFLAIAVTGFERVRSVRQNAQKMMASLVPDFGTQQTLAKSPGQPIYVSDHSMFQIVGYYAPGNKTRSRVTLVYAGDSTYISEVAVDMRAAGIQNVVPYASIAGHGAERLFLIYPHRWNWNDQAFLDGHAQVENLGPAFGGELLSVRFPLDLQEANTVVSARAKTAR